MEWKMQVYGNGMNVSRFLASILANLYPRASFQLTIGRIGESALCILIKLLIVGEDGLRFTCFHLLSLSIMWEHSFISFLSSFWNFVVRSPFIFAKLLWMKSITFSWYEFWEITKIEFPLSASEIVALLLTSISLIWFNILFSFCQEHYYNSYLYHTVCIIDLHYSRLDFSYILVPV